jgi:hypothetical protein
VFIGGEYAIDNGGPMILSSQEVGENPRGWVLIYLTGTMLGFIMSI